MGLVYYAKGKPKARVRGFLVSGFFLREDDYDRSVVRNSVVENAVDMLSSTFRGMECARYRV
jgi:hypothetical protein